MGHSQRLACIGFRLIGGTKVAVQLFIKCTAPTESSIPNAIASAVGTFPSGGGRLVGLA
jgi:hypothetical protein